MCSCCGYEEAPGPIQFVRLGPSACGCTYDRCGDCGKCLTHCRCRIDELVKIITDQTPPKENDNPAVWDMVIADMKERDRVGLERYGVRLQANNGRGALVDAYQESLDLVVYMRQEIEERFLILDDIIGWFKDVGIQMPERQKQGRSVQLAAILHDIRLAILDLASIKQERDTLLRERNGEVWIWQGIPEEDVIETITCPILIQPRDLERMYIAEQFMQGKPGQDPLPMLLWCPSCHKQHIDKPEEQCSYMANTAHKIRCERKAGHVEAICSAEAEDLRWTNPPHKTHLCHFCGTTWRPCALNTTGIEYVQPGTNDNWKVR